MRGERWRQRAHPTTNTVHASCAPRMTGSQDARSGPAESRREARTTPADDKPECTRPHPADNEEPAGVRIGSIRGGAGGGDSGGVRVEGEG